MFSILFVHKLYLHILESSTYHSLKKIEGKTYKSVSNIGAALDTNIETMSTSTETAFCNVVSNKDIIKLIKSIPTPNDIIDQFKFLQLKDLGVGDLRETIKTIISPINQLFVMFKNIILNIANAIVGLIHAFSKLGLLFVHIIPSTAISISDFSKMTNEHGFIKALFMTASMIFGKIPVILVNSIFVFVPLIVIIYFLINIFSYVFQFVYAFIPLMMSLFYHGAKKSKGMKMYMSYLVSLSLIMTCVGVSMYKHMNMAKFNQ